MLQSPIERCAWSGLDDLRPVLERFLSARCRDASDVDDIVQETLIRAARYRASLADPARLRSWAMRIALNVLRDHVRRERRLPRADAGDGELDAIEARDVAPGEVHEDAHLSVAGEVVERDDALGHLQQAIVRMRAEDRAVLGSYYAGAGRCAETARACDIAPALVKVRLFRARKRLLRAIVQRVARERASCAWMARDASATVAASASRAAVCAHESAAPSRAPWEADR